MEGQREPGMAEVARLFGDTLVAALAALRLYAFLHDVERQGADAMAWLTSAAALVILVGAVWVLALTLRE